MAGGAMRFWPYRFVIDLDTYRSRGALPRVKLRFDMFLLADCSGIDDEFVERHRGQYHPMDADYWYGVDIECTSTELDRWVATQNAILKALGETATNLGRDLDAGGGLDALRKCRARTNAIATEFQSVREEINTRIDEAILRKRGPEPRWPRPQTWTQARWKRGVRERNSRYGGGIFSG
jgi:hypothetical protein